MGTAKAKGTAFETAIVKYLREHGFTSARRVPLAGANGDNGDIWIGPNPIWPKIVIECKNYAKELPYKMISDFMQEAETEAENATKLDDKEQALPLLIVKRPNLGIADSWLIWKNSYGICFRARLDDVFQNIKSSTSENYNINLLANILADNYLAKIFG